MNAVVVRRALPVFFSLLVLFVPAAPGHTQALLVVVEETLNGSTLPSPFAAHEGLAAALFDDGIVVLDLPGGSGADVEQLGQTAVSAGADYILTVFLTYTSTGNNLPRVDGHAAFRLIGVPGGKLLLQSSADGTNKGRERTVDRAAVGQEIGQAIAAKTWDALRLAAH